MEDTRTRDILDSLADLFLTGTSPAPGPHVSSPRPTQSAAATEPRRGPRLRLADEPREAGESAAEPGASATASPPAAEAVLLGNLPGFAGPWLAQYAQFLAEQHGPTVVLHLDEQQVDLEYVDAARRTILDETVDPPDEPEADAAGADPLAVLKRLVLDRAAPVRRVLVHLASCDAQALSPAGRQVLELSPQWTIVTGADDAAIVSAYQTVKQLLRLPRGVNAVDAGQRGPRRLGLMVMGSPGEAAQRVVANLDATARSFLGLPIVLVGARQRMEPVNVRFLGSFVMDDAQQARLAEGLADLLGDPMAQAAEQATSSAAAAIAALEGRGDASFEGQGEGQRMADRSTPPRPVSAGESGDASASDARAAEPGAAPVIPPAAHFAPLPMPGPEPAVQRRAVRPAAQPAQPRMFEPAQPLNRPKSAEIAPPADAQRSPSLHGWLTGLIPLEARCPDEPAIELALDEEGRVHVLAQCIAGDHSEAAAAGELARAAMSLLAARQWVRRHLELLAMTQRQCRFDPAARPTMHLFTDHSPLASRLSQRVGQTLHIHLLSPPSHSRQGWHSFALV